MYFRNYSKSIIIILILLLAGSKSMAQQNVIADVDRQFRHLSWVVGFWDRTGMEEHRSGWEEWSKKSDSKYEGVGITTERGDTVFVESLQIVKKDSSLYYVADVPENPSPVWFEITELSDHHFRSENPNHDFPKQIDYYLENGVLRIVVSGDGKRVEYRFRRGSKN